MTTKKSSTTKPRSIDPVDLHALLSAVFARPDLPEKMWDYIADGLCEIDSSFNKYENPEVMCEVLSGYAPRRESGQKRKGTR